MPAQRSRGERREHFALFAVAFIALVSAAGVPVSIAEGEGRDTPAATVAAAPQAAAVGGNEAGSSETVSLDLRDIGIAEALKFLATKANMNIITSAKVSGRVTLMVQDAPLQDVFDLMIRSNNLAYVKKGDIYNVVTEDEFKSFYGKNFSDRRQVKAFHLKYVAPMNAYEILDNFRSSIGKIFVEPDTGTIMVMDAPERMIEFERAIQALEQKTTLRVFNLKYAKAKELEEPLKQQFEAKRLGYVRADERTNQLIIQMLPGRMTDVEHMISSLDQKTREVLIDARILRVRLSHDSSRGVEWEGLFNLGRKYGLTYVGSTPFAVVNPSLAAGDFVSRNTQLGAVMKGFIGSFPFSGTTSDQLSGSKDVGSESMHLGMIGRHDFDVVLKYLETIGETKILSCPQVAVINNHEAKIHVGERQAYVTTSTTTGQTSTTVSESVTFIDVGVQLAVTPTINEDGYVTMKIKPEISSVVDTLLSSSNNKIPIIDTAMAETSVMVKGGTTIMIGGLNKEEYTEVYKGVPMLGRIPYVGSFFSTKSKVKTRVELLILLTPHIISGDELTTGYDRDFGHKLDKTYQEYAPITEESDLSDAPITPRLYQSYPAMEKEKERLTLKPMRDV